MPEESTTPDLEELTRRSNEAINRGDFDAVMSFYAPDAVWVGSEIGTFEGVVAIRELIEDSARSYDDFHVEINELIDLGNGVAFAIVVHSGHPVGGTGELRLRYASTTVWSQGVIERQMGDMDIDEARAAAERLARERG